MISDDNIPKPSTPEESITSESHLPPPPDISAGDVTHTLIKAGLNVIPVVGGSFAEIFNLVVMPPAARRRNEWMASVASALKHLEEKVEGFQMEALASNEEFISIVLQATQEAI